MRELSYLGLTRSISWLLMPWLLTRQDISSHDIDYVEKVGSCFIWGKISNTCVVSMWRNDTKCKYMLMFPLKNLACRGLSRMFAQMHSRFVTVLTWSNVSPNCCILYHWAVSTPSFHLVACWRISSTHAAWLWYISHWGELSLVPRMICSM